MATITLKETITKHKTQTHYKSGTHLFLSFFWRKPKLITGILFLILVNSLVTLLPAIFIGRSLGIFEDEGYSSAFRQTALVILFAAFANYILSFTSNYALGVSSFKYERDIRQEYFDVIQGHSLKFHNVNNSSKLLSLGMNEIALIRHAYMPGLRMIIQAIFSVVLTLIFMERLIRIELVIFTLFGFIIYFILAYQYARKIEPIRNELSESLGDMTEKSQEIFRGIDVVRSFNSQKREILRHITNPGLIYSYPSSGENRN
ncbi:MAG: hypothetical protein HeimC2_00940 [Candidatus Heimdallarchaeota archaeon LC_2]|nr:MAG: hypothetical protein HeimC2_00940 [Candidatus Heimdallarchaeota archaeon LC_2]